MPNETNAQERLGNGNLVAYAIDEVLRNNYITLELGLQNNILDKIFMNEQYLRNVNTYDSRDQGTRKISIRVLSYFPDGSITFTDKDIAEPTFLTLTAIKRQFTTQRATVSYKFSILFVREEPDSLNQFIQETIPKMFNYVFQAENAAVELALRSTTDNVFYGGDATSILDLASGDKLSLSVLTEATNKLRVNQISTVLPGGTNSQGTVDPVLRRYVALVPASQITEVEGLTGFRYTGEYEIAFSGSAGYLPNEFGSVKDVAFVLDNRNLGNVPASAVVGNVHIAYSNIYIIGNTKPITTFYNTVLGVNVLSRYKLIHKEAGTLGNEDYANDIAAMSIDFFTKNYLTQDTNVTKSFAKIVVA